MKVKPIRYNWLLSLALVMGGLSAQAADTATLPATIPNTPIYTLKQTPPALPFKLVDAAPTLELPVGTMGIHHSLPHLQLKGYDGPQDLAAKVTVAAD